MEANELRIGNLVTVKECCKKDIFETTGISHEDYVLPVSLIEESEVRLYFYEDSDSHEFNISEIVPIPLTGEWIERLGFRKDFSGDGYTHDKTYICIDKELNLYSGLMFPWKKKVDYVHELQNLYFALTKEELKFK